MRSLSLSFRHQSTALPGIPTRDAIPLFLKTEDGLAGVNGQLGEGWQFRVVRLADGRVVKTLKSRSETFLRHLGKKPLRVVVFPKWAARAHVSIARAEFVIGEWQSRLAAGRIDNKLLANSRLRSDGRIEQDLVLPIPCAPIDGRLIILRLIDHIHECWTWGFSETNFHICNNFGWTRNNQITTYDLGDIGFSIEDVMAGLQRKIWRQATVLRKINPELREFYLRTMSEGLSEATLRRLWERRLPR